MKRLLVAVVVLIGVAIAVSMFIVWQHPLAVFAWMNRRALVNAGLKKTTIDTRVGQQTAFLGGSGPVLLFLHGAGDNAGTWAKVVPALTKQYRIVALDLAGHGESGPSAGPLGVGNVLDGVAGVIDNVCGKSGPDCGGQPLTIIGNSLGAWVASLYAHQHPERVHRLVLVDGGALRRERTVFMRVPADREQARALFAAVVDPGSPTPPGFVFDDIVRQFQHGAIGRMAANQADMEAHQLDSVNDLAVPVDLLWGESDRLVPLDYARQMEAQLPAVRLTTLPRCGHAPQQECPVAFRNALQIILREPPPEQRPAATTAAKRQ